MLEFFLLSVITFLITAAGYIINDIFDFKSDIINKDIVIIGNHIKEKSAILWYYIFNLLSIFLSIYLAYLVSNYYFLIIFFASIVVLKRYSSIYKHIFFLGNLIVATLSSLSIFNVYLFCDINLLFDYNENVFFTTIVFVYFCFFLTLSREIIKDLEDMEGDKIMNTKNLVSSISLMKTKIVVIFFLIMVLYPLIKFSFSINIYYVLIYNIILVLLVSLSVYKILRSKSKSDFIFISQLFKFIMVLGVFYIPFFYSLLK